MIWAAFSNAVRQMGDPRFLRVLLLGVALTIALLVGVYAAFLWVIDTFTPETLDLPLIGPVGGLDTLLGFASILLMIGMSVFLMVPVASAFSGLFLESVAHAVEDRHYPGLPPAVSLPLGDTIISSVNFFGLLTAINILAVFAYVFAGPLAPIVFWAMNGYLLGREYFTLAAERRIGRIDARALRARHWGRVWFAGTLMAAPLSIPLVNLVIPVLGAATFTHLFHSLARQR